MGCFNMMGFTSNLPIINNDDIVLLICASDKTYTSANSACDPTDRISPIFLPLFGKYNNYGGITLEDNDKTAAEITKIMGVPIDTLLDAIWHCRGIIDAVEDLNDEYLTVYNNAVEKIKSFSPDIFSECAELSLQFIMERRDIWDAMTSIYKNEDLFGSVHEIMHYKITNNIPGYVGDKNIIYFQIDDMFTENTKIDDLTPDVIQEHINKFEEHRNIIDNNIDLLYLYSSYLYMIGYKNTVVTNIDLMYEMTAFNKAMHYLSFIYKESPTASQDINYSLDNFKKLNKVYAEVINKISKQICL